MTPSTQRPHRAVRTLLVVAASLAVALLGASGAAAEPLQTASHDDHVTWPVPDGTPLQVDQKWSGPVAMCVVTSPLAAGVTADLLVSWVRQAMDAWNAVNANVEFQYQGICSGTRTPGNSINEITFATYDAADSAVGTAHTSFVGSTLVEADVTLRLNAEQQAVCWVNVLVHELGHVLGFTHSEYRSEVMGYGPCGVLRPTPAEVDILAAAYGTRTSALTIGTPAPAGAATLTLGGRQVAYQGSATNYYFRPYVRIAGDNTLALRPPECSTVAGRTDDECISNTTNSADYWPAHQELGEVTSTPGATNVVAAASLGQFARSLQPCNSVGCATAFQARIGEVRAMNTGVDFAYFARATTDGKVSVQLVNTSFYFPPDFLDDERTFEVRRRGVAGTSGLLGTCRLNLGETCTLSLSVAGMDLELLAVTSGGTKTGVWVTGLAAMETTAPPATPTTPATSAAPAGTLFLGSLPSRGFGLAVWVGGPVTSASSDPRVGAIFVSQGGALRGYTVGAPAFVNAAFLSNVGSEIPANTPVLVVVR